MLEMGNEMNSELKRHDYSNYTLSSIIPSLSGLAFHKKSTHYIISFIWLS